MIKGTVISIGNITLNTGEIICGIAIECTKEDLQDYPTSLYGKEVEIKEAGLQ